MSNRLTLKMQHSSLQFSDNRAQQAHDVRQLFAKGKAFPIKTGTEGGPETFTYSYLQAAAKEFDHVLHTERGNWIAVDRSIIKPQTARRRHVFVAKNDRIVGQMHDRVMPTLTFTHRDPRIGRIAVGGVHYPTKGRTKNDPNNDINREYAEVIHEWMVNTNKRGTLSFIAGDFNMLDSVDAQDWAFGEEWTSMADELNAHANTGHGPIDGFASYDKDHRVKAKKFEVLDDSKLFMHTDHFVCRGTWTIKHLL